MVLYDKIAAEIQKTLQDNEYSIEVLPTEASPLFLLLTIGKDKAAFATLDGKPEQNYEEAVERFRIMYADHAGDWADFDLNLVFCRLGEIKDDFYVRVEIDSYFCRKFIIDPDHLELELKGLPFVPLSVLSEISNRPVSAQTFLMRHHMSAELARYLTVPHARGNDRIIEECVHKDLGEPKWYKSEGKHFVPSTAKEIISQIRLKHLEISGFRVYKGVQEFDLDADLIVLFGPNGFGKTSFFDAIDFACTGGVARYDERFGRDVARLASALRQLDSPLDDCYVKAILSMDGRELAIERHIKDRAHAIIDGVSKSRTKTMLTIAGISEGATDIRVENLIQLFRSSHIFGQEYQSLTSDFREQSTLRENTVSRMLALQDYVQATNKSGQIIHELRRQIEEKQNYVSNLNNSLQSKQAQTEEMRRIARLVAEPDSISRIINELEERSKELGIEVERRRKPNAETVRGWRALVAGKLTSLEQTLGLVSELSKRYPEYVFYKNSFVDLSTRMDKAKKSLAGLDRNVTKLQNKLDRNKIQWDRLILKEREAQQEADNLNWALEVGPKYAAMRDKIKQLNIQYEQLNENLVELRSNVERWESKQESLNSSIERINVELAVLDKKLNALSQLSSDIVDWRSCLKKRRVASADLKKIEIELAELEETLGARREDYFEVEKTEHNLQRCLIALKESESELQSLLDTMERHVMDNVCPACGAVYETRDQLLNRLKTRRGTESKELKSAKDSYYETKSRREQLESLVSEVEFRMDALKSRRSETEDILDGVNGKLDKYRQRFTELDIQSTSRNVGQVVAAKTTEVQNQFSVNQQQLHELHSEVIKATSQLSVLGEEQTQLIQNLNEIAAERGLLRDAVDRIDKEALERGISIDMVEDTAKRRLAEMELIISNMPGEIERAKGDVQKVDAKLASLSSRKSGLEAEIAELMEQRNSHSKYLEETANLAAKIGLATEIDENKIVNLKRELEQQLNEANQLHSNLINLEVSLDSVEMSASAARIQKEMKSIENTVQKETEKLAELRGWHEYFNIAGESLKNLTSQALEEYTRSYGPLTSSIQRRLRSVYGFGDIRLRVKRGGIAVEVERRGYKSILPSDYFSESQIQIVMLSLFLSANLTQNWSRFSPILLDDPVEHFDDLNSYALVGLVKRLASRQAFGRQFIISTCDERLFKLMRQRFGAIDGRVVYYKFDSIGENGPVVVRY